MNKSKELYCFLDIARDSPDENLPLSVDLGEELSRIATSVYENDLAFQEDLTSTYVQLNDAHAQYYKPSCYLNFEVRQPVMPAGYVADGEDRVAVSRFLAADLVDYFKSTTGFDITTLVGASIDTIDGEPAVEHLRAYSETSIGMSKDAGTRYHLAMVQVTPQPVVKDVAASYWATRTKRNPLPTADSVRYTFTFPNGTTFGMEFPWTYRALKTYSGLDSFMEDYWSDEAGSRQSTTGGAGGAEEEVVRPRIHPLLVAGPQAPSVDTSELFEELAGNDNIQFFILRDGQTVVMTLPSTVSGGLKTWGVINSALEQAAERGATRLIIDLTNNGGGSICFGRALLSYFQPDTVPNFGPEDIPNSPLQHLLTTNAVDMGVGSTVWSPGFYTTQDGVRVQNDQIEVLEPGITHVRGGVARNYSEFVHIKQCGFWGNYIQPAKDFRPKDILILTHGFCGSMCSVISSHAAEYDGIRTVVAGGPAAQEQQQYMSFPGGQVMDSSYAYSSFQRLGLDTSPVVPPDPTDLVPRELLTTGTWRYCIREIYSPVALNDFEEPPLEFSFQPATYKVDDSLETAENPALLWYRILPLFDQAPPR
eukprot:CAMPEP_0119121380 /NCGR_PEP_ID=MMETSP1310-20130426/2039_1 /TAXON_ID=464262 /ORGANISM="Genus nov. species nov., Strain RCC2339" /LENGTH=591 /DNA_ID=CAMNT_0007110943 /DNA_START=311 /DNA_END=2086 /DNA_ORIENTATION=-